MALRGVYKITGIVDDPVPQTTLDNLVYTSASRLAPVYSMGWIYCLVPKITRLFVLNSRL